MDAMLAELDALHAIVQVIDQGDDPQEALDLTRRAFDLAANPKTFEAQIIRYAMAIVLGESVTLPATNGRGSWERALYEGIARAWACWAADATSPVPAEEFAKLHSRSEFGNDTKRKGAVHLMALHHWLTAVEALVEGNPVAARRFWKRAIEVGASFGTESHPVVLWAYAASFWPHKRA